MKKKLGIGVMCLSLLVGACGNAKEETAALSDGSIQEWEAVEEEGSETADSETESEPESGQDSEEPETEELETEETVAEETETKEIGTEEAEESMPEKPTYISQEFLDLLEGYVMENKGVDALEEIASGHKLSEEELEAYQSDSLVAEYIERNDGPFLKADGDNDGIEDIFVRDSGGSIGNSFFYFLEGQEDGSFKFTCRTESFFWDFGFVCYDGTNYLVQTYYYYENPQGLIVTLYQNGQVIETLSINKKMSRYEPDIVHLSAGYEELAEKYRKEGKTKWEKAIPIPSVGTAETEAEQQRYPSWGVYRSDLDNDGKQERYYKGIDNDTLQEEFDHEEDNHDSILETYGLLYEGKPYFCWVDSVGDKNILLLFCYEGRERNMLYGYLIEGDNTTTVLEINYVGVPIIEYAIYTKGINYDSDPWSPWP